MAKPYQHATSICLGLSLLAGLGIFWGLNTSSPLTIMFFLIPAVLYEVYRTEGASTKSASRGLLVVFILEILLIMKNISFDLAAFLGTEQRKIGGRVIPLGDIKVMAPTVMAILSAVLFSRTRGRYTKWLAVIIFVGSFAVVYALDPTVFVRLLQFGVKEGLDKIQHF